METIDLFLQFFRLFSNPWIVKILASQQQMFHQINLLNFCLAVSGVKQDLILKWPQHLY
jgi:hypothetical protein